MSRLLRNSRAILFVAGKTGYTPDIDKRSVEA